MRILGIDPGYATIGYAVIENEGEQNKFEACGVIKTKAGIEFSERLWLIYEEMALIFSNYLPDVAAVESLYFQNNQKTAIAVAQARGVLVLSARSANVPVFEYTPMQVKLAMTGSGRAKKPEIMQKARQKLGLNFLPKPDDAADAIAVAVCHADKIFV